MPFKCDQCKYYYCKDHRQKKDHLCEQIKPPKKSKKKSKIIKCVICKRKVNYPLSSQCPNCYQNFCEAHRLPEYHVCKLKSCREEELSMAYIRKNYPNLFIK